MMQWSSYKQAKIYSPQGASSKSGSNAYAKPGHSPSERQVRSRYGFNGF